MAAVLDCGTQILAVSAQRDISVDSEQFQQMQGQVNELAADRIPPPGVLFMPQVWLVCHVIVYTNRVVAHIQSVHQHCLNVIQRGRSLIFVTPERKSKQCAFFTLSRLGAKTLIMKCALRMSQLAWQCSPC